MHYNNALLIISCTENMSMKNQLTGCEHQRSCARVNSRKITR